MTKIVLNNTQIPRTELEQKVMAAIANALDLETDEVKLNDSMQDDLGAESLDYLDIAFTLEREFKVHFPREDLMQRASDHFGEDTLVDQSEITPLGLRMLRSAMPEVDPGLLQPGLKASQVPGLFTVETFVRVLDRLLAAKEVLSRDCPECGAQMEDSSVLPELACPDCEATVPFPSGDEVLFQDMLQLSDEQQQG